MKTELYRHFDADGQLLYVGVSWSAVARYGNGHKLVAPWADQITTMTIERFSDRGDAFTAEAAAIRDEKPKHNGKTGQIVHPSKMRSIAEIEGWDEASGDTIPEYRNIGIAPFCVDPAKQAFHGVQDDHLFGSPYPLSCRFTCRPYDRVVLFGAEISTELAALLHSRNVQVVYA